MSTYCQKSGRRGSRPCVPGTPSRRRHDTPSCASPSPGDATDGPQAQRICQLVSGETGPDARDAPHADGPAPMSATGVEDKGLSTDAPLGTLVQDLHLVVIDAARRRDGVIRSCCARLAVAVARWPSECELPSVERHAQRREAVLLTPPRREHKHRVRADHGHRPDRGRGRRSRHALVIAVGDRREVAAQVRVGRRRTCCRSRVVSGHAVRQGSRAGDMRRRTWVRVKHVAERRIIQVVGTWEAMRGCMAYMGGSRNTGTGDARAQASLGANTRAEASRPCGGGRRGIRGVTCLIPRWIRGRGCAYDPGLEKRGGRGLGRPSCATARGCGDSRRIARGDGASRRGNSAAKTEACRRTSTD